MTEVALVDEDWKPSQGDLSESKARGGCVGQSEVVLNVVKLRFFV